MTTRPQLLGAFVLLFSGAQPAPAAAAPFDAPPVVVPASAERHAGKVIWVEMVTPDLAAARKFCAGLFGWSFRDVPSGKTAYAVALLGNRPIAGLLQKAVPPVEPRKPAWLTFLAVRDVDAATRTAVEKGARVVIKPRSVPRRGRQAVLADPEGAPFALLASSSGDPSDYLAAPGDWIGRSLLVKDADKEAAFYQQLLGCDVFDLPSDDGVEHLVLSSDGFARASVNDFRKDSLRRYPHWVNFVRVVDAAGATARAVSLGGTVLVEPHVDRHGGRLSVVADPAGALVGLMEWSDSEGGRDPK